MSFLRRMILVFALVVSLQGTRCESFADDKLPLRCFKLGQEWAKQRAYLAESQWSNLQLYYEELKRVRIRLINTKKSGSDSIRENLDLEDPLHEAFERFQTADALLQHTEDVRNLLNLASQVRASSWTLPMLLAATEYDVGDVGYLVIPFQILVLENDPSPDPLIEHTRKQMESLRQPLAPKSAEALSQEVKSSRNFFDEHLKYTKKKATLSPFQMQELVRQKPLVLKVIEVTEKGFLGSPTFQEMRPMFIEMPDVAGITKGQEYTLMKMVEYRGSQSTPFNYQNTYRVLSDDEVQRIKEFLKARKIIKQTKFFRRWSDTQSGKTLEALFIDYEAGKVRLRTEEGQTVSIDRNRLSKKDLDWIAENFYYPLDR